MSDANRYRLDPLRDARTRDEKVRKGELAGAVGEARSTEVELARATERVASARAALDAARAPTVAGSAAAILRGEQFVVRRRRELERAIDARLRADAAHRGQLDAVDTARGRLAYARGQREVIERHFAQWRTQRRKLAERRED
ncbi:MAG: hypothetical protein H0T46_18365 [Deltaproteobacteria bacterium]|nr:hypothetical protein [Deltaproteobacteria bacterium]